MKIGRFDSEQESETRRIGLKACPDTTHSGESQRRGTADDVAFRDAYRRIEKYFSMRPRARWGSCNPIGSVAYQTTLLL